MTTDDEQLLREMWCAYTLHATPKPFDVKEAMRASSPSSASTTGGMRSGQK